jgi:isopentenyldiphosphate isomerase
VARRAASKPTWPGRLDHLVAGGQPAGLSCAANVVKECGEEVGVPPELAARAVAVGAVTYATMQDVGLKRDVLFC